MADRQKKDEKEYCDISGCKDEAERSLPTKKLGAVFEENRLDLNKRRSKLCKKHYREYKKATKKDRKLESLGWD